MTGAPKHLPSRRRFSPLLVAAAALLVPWTLVLAYRLPARHTTDHWDVAWVGFDIALAASLAATGWTTVRRPTWAPAVAAVAATLLLCDAWFDTVLANGRRAEIEAALEAGLVEVPLAILCVWLASRPEHTVEATLSAFRRRAANRAVDVCTVCGLGRRLPRASASPRSGVREFTDAGRRPAVERCEGGRSSQAAVRARSAAGARLMLEC